MLLTPTDIAKLRERIRKRTLKLGIVPIFDERGHHYQQPSYPEYGSVTTGLKIVKDPSIDSWAKGRALDFIKENHKKFTDLDQLLMAANQAPIQEFEGAGSIGSRVHAWRQAWFQTWIDSKYTGETDCKLPEDIPAVISSCEAIRRCVQKLQAVPMACELPLIDHKIKRGGTLDDIWAVPGVDGHELWFIDLKTSNIGDKNAYMLQVATYWHMFYNLYRIPIDKVLILHTSKTHFGKYDLIPVLHPARYWQMAKIAFKLSDMLEELNEIKKPEVAKIHVPSGNLA